jgi:nicotinamidase-related amidase
MLRFALIIVDMLNDFFERNAALELQRGQLVKGLNSLIAAFRENNQPIIWVRQEFAPDLHDAFLDMRKNNHSITIAGTPGCEILSELDRRDKDITIIKKRYSAFFGTDLDQYLERIAPDALVMAGINTHACVRTTAIDAFQRDYEVIIAEDCVASYDDVHHEISLRYLERAIARLSGNSQIIDMLRSCARSCCT